MEAHNKSCEPMDIDVSGNSLNEMDISYPNEDKTLINDYTNETKKFVKRDISVEPFTVVQSTASGDDIYQTRHVKTYHINKSQKVNSNHFKFKATLCMFVVGFISIVIYNLINIKCSNQLNLEKLKDTFDMKLYGQSKAIKTILTLLGANSRHKILFLYGGTGVGKSFAASLILDSVGAAANIYHYTMPSFTSAFSPDLMLGLTLCDHSIIIVDDLSSSDAHIKAYIEEVVVKTENLDKQLTVILIYNCDRSISGTDIECSHSVYNKVLEEFSNIKALKQLVKFEQLSEEHLRKCILTELGDRTVNDDDLSKMIKSFNVSVDGCKGVHKRMKLMNMV